MNLIKEFADFYNTFDKNQLTKVVYKNLLKTRKRLSKMAFYKDLVASSKKPIYKTIPKKQLRTYYYWLKRLREAENIEQICYKSTKPLQIRYKYNQKTRKQLINQFYRKNNYHPITSFWIQTRLTNPVFKNLALNTFLKYLRQDPRTPPKPNLVKKIHPRRKAFLGLGFLQMDVKVFGKTETALKKPLYALNFIDEESKLAYSCLIKRQTTTNFIENVQKALVFYEQNNIVVKRIRTDNFHAFKATAQLHNGLFNKYLTKLGIKHEFIPLREPQANGTIERFHQTLDTDFKKANQHLQTLAAFQKNLKRWLHFYNTKRYHYYSVLKTSFTNRFFTPLQFVHNYQLLLKENP